MTDDWYSFEEPEDSPDYFTEIIPEIFTQEDLSETHQCVLSSREVLHVFWSLTCVTANIILLFILKKKTKDSFCFTLSYWCLSNLIYMGVWLYFGVIPELCASYTVKHILYIFGIIFIHVSVIHAVMILSKNIMSSTKRCQFILCAIWITAFSSIAIIFWSPVYVYNNFKLTLTGAVDIACLMVLSTKIFTKQSKPNNELNVALASTTILSTFFVWLSDLVFYFFNLNSTAMPDAFIVILYGASIANLVLFICYDDETKSNISQKIKTLMKTSVFTIKCSDHDDIGKKEKEVIQNDV